MHVTIQASPDVLEPYKLRVPVMTTPASANSQTLSVCDHTGKIVCFLNSRIILPSEKRLDVRSNFDSIIDIVGLDGTFKGQVSCAFCHDGWLPVDYVHSKSLYVVSCSHTLARARTHTHTHTHTTLNMQVSTDVTAGCYARSRLSNNSDIHWATIKAKKRRHAMFKVDDDFGFKVIQSVKKPKSGALSDVHVYLSLSYLCVSVCTCEKSDNVLNVYSRK